MKRKYIQPNTHIKQQFESTLHLLSNSQTFHYDSTKDTHGDGEDKGVTPEDPGVPIIIGAPRRISVWD